MSFIESGSGKGYAPGWFLADDEDCLRLTKTMSAENAETADNGGKYIPMGTVYPSNDGEAIGIVYEDVDVTSGDMPGSVVVEGIVYADRLAEEVAAAAKTAMTGIKFIDEAPTITR